MPAKPSGKVKITTVKNHQKNGDTYILERQTLYDPVKKYNKILSTKLIAKIPKDTEIPVPTRPKSTFRSINDKNSEFLTAQRTHVGMMNIIDHIGKVSGIDDGIYANTDTATAQKIISLTRYLLATNGQTLPGIQTWQYNHPLPYEDGISEDVYHDLFARVGRDEGLQQNFFRSRCAGLSKTDAIAYDSSTISTYSANQIEARQGFNKASDGLKTIKLLTLYSIETRQPLAFTKQPGNLPDVITVANAIKQLTALGINTAEVITDNGYYSEQNLSELLLAGLDFITLAKVSLKWIKTEVEKQMEELTNIRSSCPFDTNTHGVCVLLKHDFKKVRKYAGQKKGFQKGDVEIFNRRLYLHIYFNAARQTEERNAFNHDLLELKAQIENGISIDELSESAQNKAKEYLSVRHWGKKIIVSFKDNEIALANRYHGYFALVSNKERDPFECLRKYRKRETIESFFEAMKQHADGTRVRVWDTDTLRGRLFVQFVALCYYEFFGEEIRKLKQSLGLKTGDPEHDKKTSLDAEKKLLSWLNKTPLYLQLQWFDTVESVTISASLKKQRWATEITSRDRLYLEKLGMAER